MNEFKRKKVQSLTLGEKLRNIRSNKRATLSDVAKNTRIQVEYLEYLEQGAYDKLPADVYVRGFLKSFAEYLNVDEKDLIRSFKKERSIQQNIQKDEDRDSIPKKISLSNFSISPKIISIIIIPLLFIGMSFYLYRKLDNFISTPELIILNPETNSVVYDSQVILSGRTDEGNNVFINNQPVLVDENGNFKESLVLRVGINVISVRSINRFDKEAVRELSVDAQYEVNIPEDNNRGENNSENGNGSENSASDQNAESLESAGNETIGDGNVSENAPVDN